MKAAWLLLALACAPVRARSDTPVLAYVESGPPVGELDLAVATHVLDAFVLVEPSGALRPHTQPGLVAAAHAAGARALVSVGGATVPGETFAAVARRPDRFLDELARLVADWGYDGVDLDWEFPAPGEAALHLSLVRAIRARLPKAILTVGLSPGSRLLGFDLPGLAAVVDYAILFGYDWRNPALGPWAHTAKLWPDGAQEPIEASVRGAVAAVRARGLPREKLIVALPMYTSRGRPWSAVRGAPLGPLDPLYLERRVGDEWVTDPVAMEAKVRAALPESAGVALWQLGHQGAGHDLTDAVRRATTRP